MSIRPRRALVGLLAGLGALAVSPATALAAGETLTVTPASTQAGGGTNVTATLGFAAGDTPKTVVTSLAPGMLGNLNANLSCLAAAQLTNPACLVGTATAHLDLPPPNGTDLPGTLYLVPAAQGTTDVAGIEFVPTSPPPGVTNQYVGVSPNPNTPGSLNLTTTFPDTRPAHIASFTVNFTTLNGQPFTRLPSSCAAATSTVNVQSYYGGTAAGSASGSFTPTGCSGLPYAPKLTATITKDSNDNGAALVTEVTQAATESASKTIVLQFPKGLLPNVQADVPCLTGSGPACTVGTATATSPLVPSIALSNGTVTLGGSATAPTIAVDFPALGITLPGTVSLTSNTVTFTSVPDVPLTDLKLSITGPSGGKAFTTDCVPANIGGTFTPQSGTTPVTVSSAITFSNCAVAPTATGSTSGLASGHPKLKFKVTHGQGAANVAAVTIGVPGGLKFSRSAIVNHKVCTTKGKKKKCTTTTLIKGLLIVGGKAKSVAIKGGKLVITLKKSAASLSITAAGPLVSESKALQTKVKKHKAGTLKFSLKITDASKKATTLSLKLKAH